MTIRSTETTTYEYDDAGRLVKEVCVIDDVDPLADLVEQAVQKQDQGVKKANTSVGGALTLTPNAPFARWEPSWTGRKPFRVVEAPALSLLSLQDAINRVHEPAYQPQRHVVGHPSTLPQRSAYVGSHR